MPEGGGQLNWTTAASKSPVLITRVRWPLPCRSSIRQTDQRLGPGRRMNGLVPAGMQPEKQQALRGLDIGNEDLFRGRRECFLFEGDVNVPPMAFAPLVRIEMMVFH